jgi:hypothetical protein
MDQHRCACFAPDCDSGSERLQVERGRVDSALQFRVSRIQHLKAAVTQKAVDRVGANSAADAIILLPHPNVASGGREDIRTSQAGQPGTDHYYVNRHRLRPSSLPRRPTLEAVGSDIAAKLRVKTGSVCRSRGCYLVTMAEL